MKNRAKKLMGLLLVLALVFSFSVPAMAKTESSPIAVPADDTTVFYVKAGTKTVSYTWADISGKNEFKTVSKTYGDKVNNEQTTKEWTGVLLSDLLADVEKEIGMKFADDYTIKATAADDYAVVFSAGDVRDPNEHYMVSCDPVSNKDGAAKYDDSYVRILRGDKNTLSNNANIRCILGIEVLDASGNPLTVPQEEKPALGLAKKAGGDVENSVFYIAVKETASSPIKYYYYTLDELKAYGDIHDFSYNDHTVDKTVKGKGVFVSSLLENITDADITDEMIVQYAESDGYHADQNTPVDESSYKDKVAWLKESHTDAGGVTVEAVDTMVCYETWTTYDHPDETNVNSTEWEDADAGSGYLRAYRQTADANNAVIKTLMGIVVSSDGQAFSGKDGYTLKAVSDTGMEILMIEPSTGKTYTSQTITGLMPGMKYAVKAPDVNNASVKKGDALVQTINAKSGTDQTVTFTYTEKNYLTLVTPAGTKDYTYTQFSKDENAVQTPSAEEVESHGVPYGYYNAMYYRYNGIWLKDLAGNVSSDVTVRGTDGSTMTIKAQDVPKYFLTYGHTESKSSTNVSEGKRFSFAYVAPKLIIPADGTLVGEKEANVAGNKMVTVAKDGIASVSTQGAPVEEGVFSDMNGFGWAKEAVEYLSKNEIVNGTSDTTFSPKQNIKRGDFMLMLCRAYDLKADTDENFTDVVKGSYWYDAIAAAKALGIAQGSGNKFNPSASITRQDAMVLLHRTLEQKGKVLESSGDLSSFGDAASVAAYAKDAVSALTDAGIITGKNGNIIPKDNMSRAEMAVALYRAITKLA